MPMNEPIPLPDIETRSDGRNVEAARMLDRRLVCVMLHHRRAEDSVAMIDEMDAVLEH